LQLPHRAEIFAPGIMVTTVAAGEIKLEGSNFAVLGFFSLCFRSSSLSAELASSAKGMSQGSIQSGLLQIGKWAAIGMPRFCQIAISHLFNPTRTKQGIWARAEGISASTREMTNSGPDHSSLRLRAPALQGRAIIPHYKDFPAGLASGQRARALWLFSVDGRGFLQVRPRR